MGFHPVEIRIQVLTLTAWGIPTKEIAVFLELPLRTVHDIISRAKARGFDPVQHKRVKMEFVEDAKRSGRPKEKTKEVQNAVVQSVTTDQAGSEKSSEI
ncbi:hypothetical protein BDV28DRAFT_141992 [Aspergillus coremiiformis]|uniref:Uncharacterized protein n=1 Tax=Aspergillus coremiiformis TaxID=138285 RepID=A0A5N6YUA9_9EURO|nr:hypothetical protein BDV28DRAFT_141992 [Aspergillus coremiiformis]